MLELMLRVVGRVCLRLALLVLIIDIAVQTKLLWHCVITLFFLLPFVFELVIVLILVHILDHLLLADGVATSKKMFFCAHNHKCFSASTCYCNRARFCRGTKH